MSLINDSTQDQHVLHYATIHWSTVETFLRQFGTLPRSRYLGILPETWEIPNMRFFKKKYRFLFLKNENITLLFVNAQNIKGAQLIKWDVFRKTIKLYLDVDNLSTQDFNIWLQRSSCNVYNPYVTCVITEIEPFLPFLTSHFLLCRPDTVTRVFIIFRSV